MAERDILMTVPPLPVMKNQVFDPKLDITVWELALATAWLFARTGAYLELPTEPGVRRHFREV